MTHRGEFTDLANAEKFLEQHRDTLKFVPGLGWYEWQGKQWVALLADPVPAAVRTVESMQPGDWNGSEDPREWERRVQWWQRSRSEPTIRRMIGLARDMPAMRRSADEFDAHPTLLNCPDGVVDLETGKLQPHDPALYLTKMAGVAYRPKQACPKWEGHVSDAMGGERDMMEFLHRALGYTLGGSTSEQVLFIVHGPGSTGKSLTLNVVRKVLGDYAQTADRNLLIKSPANAIGHNLVQLKGARFVMASETGAGNELDEVAVKMMTGSDAVTGRLLHRNNISFTPSAKVWLATNHKPGIKSMDSGIWRRIREIPFDHVVESAWREADYDKRIFAEEGTGVLRWLVAGYRKWRAGGLTEPEAVIHAVEDYASENDPHGLGTFIGEVCSTYPSATTPIATAYSAYAAWHSVQEDMPEVLSKWEFARRLVERGFRRGRAHGGSVRTLVGITVGKATVN